MKLTELQNKIYETINTAQLPADAIFFVIKDIYRDVEQLYYKEVQKEENQNQKKIKEVNKPEK